MRRIICEKMHLLHLLPELGLPSAEMLRSQSKTTNQIQEEGLKSVNQACVIQTDSLWFCCWTRCISVPPGLYYRPVQTAPSKGQQVSLPVAELVA